MKIIISIIVIVVIVFAGNAIMNLIVRNVYKSMGFDIDEISKECVDKIVKKFKKRR